MSLLGRLWGWVADSGSQSQDGEPPAGPHPPEQSDRRSLGAVHVHLADGPTEDEDAYELLHEEARTVLDHQIGILDDVDDKAARTVRITMILVGAVLGIASLGGDNGVSLSNPYVVWASCYLVVSILLGMATYNVSDPYFGPGKSDMEQLIARTDSREELLRDLVDGGYRTWISNMEDVQAVNGTYLDLTQTALSFGLIGLVLGFAYRVTSDSTVPAVYSVLDAHSSSLLWGLPLAGVVLAWGVLFLYSVFVLGSD